MMKRIILRRGLLAMLALVILAAYWLLPISGRVFVMWDDESPLDAWPRLRLEPEMPRPGEKAVAVLADTVPWVHIKLLVNDQEEAQFLRYEPNPFGGEWFWSYIVPETDTYELAFYHDCDQGCVSWSRNQVSNAVNVARHPSARVPTKLGVVFANAERDWHDRSGWILELTYTQLAQAEYWGIEDLATRVQKAVAGGHRVLLRVDYDQDQSIPHDEAALRQYLEVLRILARDDRFQGIYGVIIGSSYNALASNRQAADTPVTPEWYARLFSGHDMPVSDSLNVSAVIRAENPIWRILVGPVQPGVEDQAGQNSFGSEAPWLSYFNTLLTALVTTADIRAEANTMGALPDGFAIQALGMLESDAEAGASPGFQVYRDWLAVINSFDQVRNFPVYITASNSYQMNERIVPAQNYPPGWLSQALTLVNQEAQIRALCWFVDDVPVDQQWRAFSLTAPQGAMVEAAREFDQLLRQGP